MGRNYLKGRDGDRINAVLAPPATTSASSCAGWPGFCAPSSRPSARRRRSPKSTKNGHSTVLHGRVDNPEVDGQHRWHPDFRRRCEAVLTEDQVSTVLTGTEDALRRVQGRRPARPSSKNPGPPL